ncbi:MAG: hypothetical protein ABIG11_04045, partial [bacterium]
DDGTRLTPAWNSEQKIESWFQNYAFSYGGYHFICLDLNSRKHAILGEKGSWPYADHLQWLSPLLAKVGIENEKGAMPGADLYEMPGGTFPWLREHFNAYPRRGERNMLIFAHQPLSKDPLNFGLMSFSPREYQRMTTFLSAKDHRNSVGLWAAGHIHRNWEYNVKTWDMRKNICPGIETGAGFNGVMRLITVWGAEQ